MLRAVTFAGLPALLLAGLLLVDPAPAQNVREAGALPEVDLRFLDGSAARVVLLQESIDIETRYGKLTVPCADIRRVELSLRLDEETGKRIVAALQGLGSDAFHQREAAGKELLRLAIPAYHALKKAPPSKDTEVARRTAKLVKEIEHAVPAARLKVRTDDLVQARDFTIPGKVTARTVRVRSKYFGEAELKVSDLSAWDAASGAFLDVTAPFAEQTGLAKAAFWLERRNFLAAHAEAKEFARDKPVEDLARLFKPRTKGGLGIGFQPGAVTPDGIELLLLQLDKRAAQLEPTLAAHAADVARAFYLTAAIGEAHRHHCPLTKKVGRKDPADWERWSVAMRDSAIELADAVQRRQPARTREVAKQLNNACFSCHDVFRECN